MIYHAHFNNVHEVVQLLAEHGLGGMANAIRILLNEAMKIERAQYLIAEWEARPMRYFTFKKTTVERITD